MSAAARESLLSPDWYRVASMRPRLRDGVRVTRQRVRGETWYVLSDPMTGRHHRFNGLAYGLIAACDGQRTLDEVWAARAAADGDDAATQGEAIRIFSQAFGANLFIGDVAPDAAAIVRAHTRSSAQRRRSAVNPFAFRLPLWDPDVWLERHVHRVRGLFGRASLWGLALIVALGVLLLALNADAVAAATRQHLGSGRLLLLMWLAYPLIKALHEMAHAFAVKAYGGQVHEVGITLLCLTPVPFVDASASGAFADKRERVAVVAAGIVVEVVLAAAALTLWLALQPGLLRDVAFAVVAVTGLSTLLVNGNPLLRFDGYFVATDALELPNLAQRSTRYWQLAIKRRLLGLQGLRMPGLARGERALAARLCATVVRLPGAAAGVAGGVVGRCQRLVGPARARARTVELRDQAGGRCGCLPVGLAGVDAAALARRCGRLRLAGAGGPARLRRAAASSHPCARAGMAAQRSGRAPGQ